MPRRQLTASVVDLTFLALQAPQFDRRTPSNCLIENKRGRSEPCWQERHSGMKRAGLIAPGGRGLGRNSPSGLKSEENESMSKLKNYTGVAIMVFTLMLK